MSPKEKLLKHEAQLKMNNKSRQLKVIADNANKNINDNQFNNLINFCEKEAKKGKYKYTFPTTSDCFPDVVRIKLSNLGFKIYSYAEDNSDTHLEITISWE